MKKTKKNSGRRPKNFKKIAKRLAAYSAAAAATVVASQDRSADAGQVFHDPIPDVTIGDQPGLLFNMVSGTTALAPEIAGNATPGSMRILGYFSPDYPNAYIYTPAGDTMGAFVGAGSNVSPLALGAIIDDNLTFGATPYGAGNYGNLAAFAVGDSRYIGIRFDLDGSAHFGWAQVTRINAQEIALETFGYNDVAGEAATAGFVIPEPSSILLLAAGAAGLALWRRRRNGKPA